MSLPACSACSCLPPRRRLQAYAVAFFAIPAVRSLQNAARNREIEVRNEAREAALRLLQQPDQVLKQKLATARAQGQRNVISERWVGVWVCIHAWPAARDADLNHSLECRLRLKCLLSTCCPCCACCAYCCCRDAIFRSDRPLEQQPTDIEADNFNAKLERRARERQQQQGAQRQPPPPQQEAAPQWWLDQQARQQQKDRR